MNIEYRGVLQKPACLFRYLPQEYTFKRQLGEEKEEAL